jgi:hypothetical protein
LEEFRLSCSFPFLGGLFLGAGAAGQWMCDIHHHVSESEIVNGESIFIICKPCKIIITIAAIICITNWSRAGYFS